MPTFIVHTLDQAGAALTAAAKSGASVTLMSAPSAATGVGGAYFQRMIAEARRAVPGAVSTAVLDCGSSAGFALAALRAGAEAVHVSGDPAVIAKLVDIATQTGGAVVSDVTAPLADLRQSSDPFAHATELLGGVETAGCAMKRHP